MSELSLLGVSNKIDAEAKMKEPTMSVDNEHPDFRLRSWRVYRERP